MGQPRHACCAGRAQAGRCSSSRHPPVWPHPRLRIACGGQLPTPHQTSPGARPPRPDCLSGGTVCAVVDAPPNEGDEGCKQVEQVKLSRNVPAPTRDFPPRRGVDLGCKSPLRHRTAVRLSPEPSKRLRSFASRTCFGGPSGSVSGGLPGVAPQAVGTCSEHSECVICAAPAWRQGVR